MSQERMIIGNMLVIDCVGHVTIRVEMEHGEDRARYFVGPADIKTMRTALSKPPGIRVSSRHWATEDTPDGRMIAFFIHGKVIATVNLDGNIRKLKDFLKVVSTRIEEKAKV